MRIANDVDTSFSFIDIDRASPVQKQSRPSEYDSRRVPPSPVIDQEQGGREASQGMRIELERKGMEVSFSVDPSSGRAQMVVVESGTGREVLKVPSDSALYRILMEGAPSAL